MLHHLPPGNLVSKSGLDLSQMSGFTVVAEKLNFFRYISHFRFVWGVCAVFDGGGVLWGGRGLKHPSMLRVMCGGSVDPHPGCSPQPRHATTSHECSICSSVIPSFCSLSTVWDVWHAWAWWQPVARTPTATETIFTRFLPTCYHTLTLIASPPPPPLSHILSHILSHSLTHTHAHTHMSLQPLHHHH